MAIWSGVDLSAPEAEREGRRDGWLAVPLALLALAGAGVVFAPFGFSAPGQGLDSSWVAVLGEARARGWRFGTDIVFTGGPLSVVYTDYFEAGLAPLTIGFRLLLSVAFAGLVTVLAWRNRRLAVGLAAVLAVPLLVASRDAVFLGLPLLTALVALPPGGGRPGGAVVVPSVVALGVVASAVVTLAKFSVFPVAVACLLLADAVRLSDRRAPLLTLGYLAAAALLFAVLEAPDRIVPFVVGSLDVSAGYSEAMFTRGAPLELWSFLTATGVLFAVVVRRERAALMAGDGSRLAAVARVLALAVYVFMIWKAGFVRHDMHTTIAWGGLALAAIAHACTGPGRTVVPLGIAAASLLVAIPLVFAFAPLPNLPPFHRVVIDKLFARVAETRAFATDPAGRFAALSRQKEEAWAQIRAAHPLPKLSGSVDVIPSVQSALLAHGFDYQPRPSIQEFSTYTPRLVAANRTWLAERGPDRLLFQPGSIDARHPALAEGPLWPDIMRRYRPAGWAGDLLVLERRETPLPELLGPPTTLTAAYKETVPLPRSDDPLMLFVETGKTPIGRLGEILFRPPEIHAVVSFSNGWQRNVRIVPEIARAGFVISPMIWSATEFLFATSGRGDRLPQATAITFRTNTWGRLHYGGSLGLTLRPLSAAVLRQDPLPAALAAQVEDDGLVLLLNAATSRGGVAGPISEGLFAHPPLDLDVTLPRASRRLKVAHGIVDQAWQVAGGTDGVCFAVVRRRGGVEQTLYERCLDPKRTAADRGRQSADVPADLAAGDVVRFKTICRTDCRYAWAYWRDLRFDD